MKVVALITTVAASLTSFTCWRHMQQEELPIPPLVDVVDTDFGHREDPMYIAADCAARAVNFVSASAAYAAERCGASPACQRIFESEVWTYLQSQVQCVRLWLNDADIFAAVANHSSFVLGTFQEQVTMAIESFSKNYPEHREAIEYCGPAFLVMMLITGIAFLLRLLWVVAAGLLQICGRILYHLSPKKNRLEDVPKEK